MQIRLRKFVVERKLEVLLENGQEAHLAWA